MHEIYNTTVNIQYSVILLSQLRCFWYGLSHYLQTQEHQGLHGAITNTLICKKYVFILWIKPLPLTTNPLPEIDLLHSLSEVFQREKALLAAHVLHNVIM